MSRAGRRSVAVVLIAAFGLASCGSDSEPASTEAASTAPVTTAAPATTLPSATTTPTTTTAEAATTTVEPTSDTCPSYTEKDDLPLTLCDSGAKVQEVQEGLVDAGYDIVVDGFFGNQTRNAVLEFQAANGLEVDGVVGPLTFGKLFPTE